MLGKIRASSAALVYLAALVDGEAAPAARLATHEPILSSVAGHLVCKKCQKMAQQVSMEVNMYV